MLKVGDKAPDFTLRNTHGMHISLSSFKGKDVVLYFYPKDFTGGCTLEACNIRDNYETFKKKNVVVLGVSMDNDISHQRFTAKYKLPFMLLTDPDAAVCKKYGAYGEKSFLGKKYMGIIRTTFIIDKYGKIKEIIKKVDTKNHSQQIFEVLK